MIKLEKVNKIYQTGGATECACCDVSLEINSGEFVAVVGHSGSGKTTLVSLMGGLTRPSAGKVLIAGTDIWTLEGNALARLRGKKIGFCFQFSSLLPTLTCLDNVRLPGAFSGSGAGINSDKALEMLATVGVAEKAGSYPSELSGGQQRRVAIARALVHDPEIILADEPTGDLDEATEGEIMALFENVNGRGVTIVMVTHSQSLARRAGRTLTMSHGKLSEGVAADFC